MIVCEDRSYKKLFMSSANRLIRQYTKLMSFWKWTTWTHCSYTLGCLVKLSPSKSVSFVTGWLLRKPQILSCPKSSLLWSYWQPQSQVMCVVQDPSCYSYSNALLFYKGYHAIQVHRTAHHLWKMGLEVSARALQARVSEVNNLSRWGFKRHIDAFVVWWCQYSYLSYL